MIEIQDLNASYGNSPVLSGVSFTVADRSLHAVIGKNGSGKSTLVKCFNRTIPYSGKIEIDGEDISKMTSADRAKSIAILPQTLPFPDLTVGELISLGRSPYTGISGRLGERDIELIRRSAELCGVEEFFERGLRELSGGERQRAFLAMILAQDTGVIILDEPTTYMDMAYETSFLRLLERVKKDGRTLLVVMHNLSLAVKYSDSLTVLDGGVTAFCGATATCLESRIIEKVFGVTRHTLENGETVFTSE